MRRLSSSATFFYKRVFPWCWLGFVALFALLGPAGLAAHGHRVEVVLPFLVVPLGMLVIGFVLFRTLLFNLLDEVWLDSDALLVKSRGQQARIRLVDVINVNSTTMTNPARITVQLRNDSRFGRRVSFIPTSPRGLFSGFRGDPVADDLIVRVDATRRSQP